MKNSGKIPLTIVVCYTDSVLLIIARAIDGENGRAPAGTAPREYGINGIAAAVFSP
jgi:hypothetical protein